jgi:hypothetical protein
MPNWGLLGVCGPMMLRSSRLAIVTMPHLGVS